MIAGTLIRFQTNVTNKRHDKHCYEHRQTTKYNISPTVEAYAVVRYLIVRPSRSCIVSKLVIISSNAFHDRVATPS